MKRWIVVLCLLGIMGCKAPQHVGTPNIVAVPASSPEELPYGWRETWVHEVRPVRPYEEPVPTDLWLASLLRQLLRLLSA